MRCNNIFPPGMELFRVYFALLFWYFSAVVRSSKGESRHRALPERS